MICKANFWTNRNNNRLWISKLANRNRNSIQKMGSICKLFMSTWNIFFFSLFSHYFLVLTHIHFSFVNIYLDNQNLLWDFHTLQIYWLIKEIIINTLKVFRNINNMCEIIIFANRNNIYNYFLNTAGDALHSNYHNLHLKKWTIII